MSATARTALRVSCIQLAYPAAESSQQRFERVAAMVEAEAPDADLVVLPELWLTGYFSFDRYEAEATPLDAGPVAALAHVAARAGIHLMAGTFIERHNGGLANSAVLLGPDGSRLHAYRKIHLFGYGSQEAKLLTAGEEAGVAHTAVGCLGMTTCYDLRFPELYRLLGQQGAELVVIPAAWPRARLAHWRVLLQARAIENQVVVIACNGAGEQGSTELAGHSMLIGPWGDILAEAGEGPQILRAEVDLADVTAVREEFPVLQHRRL